MCAGELEFVYTTDGVGGTAWSYTPEADLDLDAQPYRPWAKADAYSADYQDNWAPEVNFVQATIERVLRGDERRGGARHKLAACPQSDCFNGSFAVTSAHGGLPQPFNLSESPGCCLATETKGPLEAVRCASGVARVVLPASYAVTCSRVQLVHSSAQQVQPA